MQAVKVRTNVTLDFIVTSPFILALVGVYVDPSQPIQVELEEWVEILEVVLAAGELVLVLGIVVEGNIVLEPGRIPIILGAAFREKIETARVTKLPKTI